MSALKYAAAAGYLASVVGANWAIAHVGTPTPNGPHVLPVWPGIMAPSGVYIVGITLVLRDIVQRQTSKAVTFALILVGAALSWTFSPSLAFASTIAFVIAELVDFAVFSALEKRGELLAVAASNAVSIVVDSALFLVLAFGSLAFIEGQIIGKAWATAAALIVLAAMHHRRAVTA